MTTDRTHRAAVCVLRVEAQGEQLLITVTTNHDLDRRLYSARPGSVRRTSDVAEALAATEEFLRSFTAGGHGREGPAG